MVDAVSGSWEPCDSSERSAAQMASGVQALFLIRRGGYANDDSRAWN